MRSETAKRFDLFQVFVINLERRPDRLAKIAEALGRLGIGFTRIAAVDARTVSGDLLDAYFERSGPLGVLSTGDKCCTLSHRLAWQALADSNFDWGVVLEDDVVLSRDFGSVLNAASSIPPGIELVKLERCLYSHRVLLAKAAPGPAGHALQRILSKHVCGAGYMIRRESARAAIAQTQRMAIPVDHLLFNPNMSALCRKLAPYQLCPAVVEQSSSDAGEVAVSDIKPWRVSARPFGLGLWRRELVRAYYETRLLPSQLFHYAAGARFTQVELGGKNPPGAEI